MKIRKNVTELIGRTPLMELGNYAGQAEIEGVRLLGVSISHLEQEGAAPVLNFNDNEKLKKRNAAVDFLKNKFGEGIIKRG